MVPSVKSALLLQLLNMNKVPEKLYLYQWYSKKLSSQCNLTAEIEPVQDKL